MRKFTRVLCLCLMLALVFSLGMPAAFAEGTEPEPEAVEPTSTPAPEVPEPTPTPAPEVPDPETPSPYVEPRFPCLHKNKETVKYEASTCSKNGSIDWVCKDCGATGTISLVKNPFEHNPSATNIVSGSFIDASHTVECSDCGLKWSELHSRVIDSEKPATCLEDGHSAGVYCSAGCGYDTRTVYKADGHKSETIPGKEATCTEAGLTEGTKCSVCGEILVAQEVIPAKGHTWGEWELTTAATCTQAGVETRTCSVCQASETRSITATGHTWDDWEVTTAATCTQAGVETRTCSVCQASETRPIAATGHTEEAIPDQKATCTEPGSVGGKRCSVCKAVLEEPELVPATGHDWGLWADTKDGWRHVRFCANDPAHKQYEFHKMGNWITVKYNTETTDGYRERWCQAPDCDYHEVQVIRAGSPKTGDSSNILFYSGLCLASLCAASGLIVFAKRRKEQ